MRTNYFRSALMGPIMLITLTGLLPGCSFPNPHTPHITIKTAAGDIEVELRRPKIGTDTRRYLETNNKKAIAHQDIPHGTTQLTHIQHKDGTISLARTTPGKLFSHFLSKTLFLIRHSEEINFSS
jgi:hypothetical protein